MTPETMSAAERDAKRKSKWDTAQEISDNFITLEIGQSVEGFYRESTPVYFRASDTTVNRYTIERETDDGKSERIAILGSVGLDDKMKNIPINTEVFIRLDGVEKTKGKNPFKKYTVKYL